MQQVIEEGRIAVQGLRTGRSSAVSLETALSQIKDEVSPDDRVDFRVIVEGLRRELHPVLQGKVYRIGREALINAFRHSRAKHIEVELNYAPERLPALFARRRRWHRTERTECWPRRSWGISWNARACRGDRRTASDLQPVFGGYGSPTGPPRRCSVPRIREGEGRHEINLTGGSGLAFRPAWSHSRSSLRRDPVDQHSAKPLL